MYSPNLGRPLASGEITKTHVKRAPHVQGTSTFISFLRGLFLGWAFLRLVISVLWTSLIIIATVAPFLSPEQTHRMQPSRLLFNAFAIFVQLVEFGMIVTFITAGVKKRASLYRAYYYYCILTFIIYIIAMILCFTLGYENGHYYAEIYLTYHVNDYIVFYENDAVVILVATISDICLEIFLILAVRRLIREYSYNQNNADGEYV